jgi:hypothetical protein
MLTELHKEKIELNPFKWNIFDIILVILVVLILFNLFKAVHNNSLKFTNLIIILFIIILIIVKVDEKLVFNTNLINKKIKIDDIYEHFDTGDIVLYRTYKKSGPAEHLLMMILLPLSQEVYSKHVGIILKDKINKKIYVAEDRITPIFCKLSNKHKNGVVFTEVHESLNNPFCRIFIYKTNINKYVTFDKLLSNIKEMKELSYLENLFYCSTFLQKILNKENIIKSKGNTIIYTPDELINKNNYLIDIDIQEPLLVDNGNDVFLSNNY